MFDTYDDDDDIYPYGKYKYDMEVILSYDERYERR